jgi:hypothetical protein
LVTETDAVVGLTILTWGVWSSSSMCAEKGREASAAVQGWCWASWCRGCGVETSRHGLWLITGTTADVLMGISKHTVWQVGTCPLLQHICNLPACMLH